MHEAPVEVVVILKYPEIEGKHGEPVSSGCDKAVVLINLLQLPACISLYKLKLVNIPS